MQRVLALVLIAALIIALPVWPYSKHWTYGPAIAVAFLLAVNLLVPVCDYFSNRRKKPDRHKSETD